MTSKHLSLTRLVDCGGLLVIENFDPLIPIHRRCRCISPGRDFILSSLAEVEQLKDWRKHNLEHANVEQISCTAKW